MGISKDLQILSICLYLRNLQFAVQPVLAFHSAYDMFHETFVYHDMFQSLLYCSTGYTGKGTRFHDTGMSVTRYVLPTCYPRYVSRYVCSLVRT